MCDADTENSYVRSYGFVPYVVCPVGSWILRRREAHGKPTGCTCSRTRILLVRSRDGSWDFPKGTFDRRAGDRSGMDAARREFREETGLDPNICIEHVETSRVFRSEYSYRCSCSTPSRRGDAKDDGISGGKGKGNSNSDNWRLRKGVRKEERGTVPLRHKKLTLFLARLRPSTRFDSYAGCLSEIRGGDLVWLDDLPGRFSFEESLRVALEVCTELRQRCHGREASSVPLPQRVKKGGEKKEKEKEIT